MRRIVVLALLVWLIGAAGVMLWILWIACTP